MKFPTVTSATVALPLGFSNPRVSMTSSCSTLRRCLFVALGFLAFATIEPSHLFGQVAVNGTGTWNRTTAGPFNWAPPTSGGDRNWWGVGNGDWVSGLTSVANMTNNITADQTVHLETNGNALLNVSLLTLTMGDSTSVAGVYQNFTISAPTGGVLTIGTSSGVGAINSSNGTNTISAGITLGNAATFQHTTAGGSLIISGAVTNGGNLLTIGGAGNTTISGIIGSGAGGLTKNGAGNLNLNAANTYTGTTTVNVGSLIYGINNAIASGAVTVSGGTLSITTFSDTVGAVSLTSGSITGSGGTLTGTSYAVESGTISAILGGSGIALTKSTGGSVTLSGLNTYTGTTTVNAGTLAYGVTNAIASGAVTVSGGTLSIAGFSDTVGAVSLTSGSITGSGGTLTGTSYAVEAGSVSAILGGSGVALTKSTGGSVTLSGVNTYTGTTTVNAGTLIYGVNNALSTGGLTVNATGTVNIGSFIDTVGSVIIDGGTISGSTGVLSSTANFDGRSGTVSAILGGSTGFDKSTGGSLTLSGVNAYTGATTINAGTLFVNGSLAAASTVTVNSTGTLGGTGTINGDVNVVSGQVSPGTTGASTLTVNGNFSLNSSATLTFDLVGNDMTVGGGINDLINGVDDLTLDGSLNVLGAGSFLGTNFGDKWRLFNYTGILNNFGLTLGSVPTLSAGYSWVIDTSTFGQVNLFAVPEPGSMALLAGLSIVGAFVVIRRKRNRMAI